MNYNFTFCKVGKSIKFDSAKYSPTGGDNEPGQLLMALANNNPNCKFYIIGRSDFGKLSTQQKNELFPYGNVIDVWHKYPINHNVQYYEHILNYFKGKKVDFNIVLFGQTSGTSIPDRINKIGSDENAKIMSMTLGYTTPIVRWLNEGGAPYLEIVHDPRYTSAQLRDLYKLPEFSLGQFNYVYEKKHIISYEDQTIISSTISSVYAGMETTFCFGKKFPENKPDKDKLFGIVLNEGSPSRYKEFEKYIINNGYTFPLWGKWKEEKITTEYPNYMGSENINVLQELIKEYRATLTIPIAPGWVTSKYIEMAHAGVIPLLHPTYDAQFHTGIKNILRVNSPQEFKEVLDKIEKDNDFYTSCFNASQEVLVEKYYNGTFLSESIMQYVYSFFGNKYQIPDLEKYEKVKENPIKKLIRKK